MKINKLKEQALSLWENPECSIRELAHVIGLIVSSFPAIKPARLYYRELEVCKLEALSNNDGDYNSFVQLSQSARDCYIGLLQAAIYIMGLALRSLRQLLP